MTSAEAELDLRLETTFPWWRGTVGEWVRLSLFGMVAFPCIWLVALVIIVVQGRFSLRVSVTAAGSFLPWAGFWTGLMALCCAAAGVGMQYSMRRRQRRNRLQEEQ